MLVFGRALPIFGLGDLRVATGFAAGLDGLNFSFGYEISLTSDS
jgi:hypothetical protein